MSGQTSNFGDDGGSIMDQINALFAPPGGDTTNVKTTADNSELHPYFKRPGRGHNHDNCDSCGEGGDLICCDYCPSSFHFQCHDPPLEDKDIPEGDWICIKCFSSRAENRKLVAEAKKQRAAEEKAFKPVKVKSKPKVVLVEDEVEVEAGQGGEKMDEEWKPAGKGKAKKVADQVGDSGRSVRPSRGLKQKYDEQFEEEMEECMVLEEEKIEKVLRLSVRAKTYRELYIDHLAMREEKTNPTFDALLAVVRSTNGEEFQLPAKMNVAEKFPYSWKWSEPKKGKSRADEDLFEPRGQVKFCYVCVKSSRIGPLIECDYCSSVFHMDCLDPPLSEIPRDVWMCPNHVENFLDSKLLNSTSITKRLELWEKYAKRPIDQNSVKIAFLNRAHRKVPAYKRKVLASSIRRVSVPKFIKDIYANPRPLIPGPGYEHWLDPTERGVTVREIKASRQTICNTNLTEDKVENETAKGATENRLEDEMEWVAGLVSLQTDILKNKMEKGHDTVLVEENEMKHNNTKIEGGNELDQNNTKMERDNNLEHNDLANKINKELIIHNDTKMEGDSELEGINRNAKRDNRVQNNAIDKMEEDNNPEHNDMDIKVEDSSEEKQGDNVNIRSPGESTISGRSLSPRFTDPDNFGGLTAKLHEYLMSHGKDAALLNPTILQYLATKQYESMFSSELSSSSRMSEVASRAALAPIGSRKTPAYMKYRSLVIGTGGDCHMNLTSYGHCNYVSAKHATVFYDELSDQYELINYSEFGTLVDNCLYTLDTLSITARKDIIDESSKLLKNEESCNVRTMAAPGWSSRSCYCRGPASSIAAELAATSGCEASALLHHGCHVRFGCLVFVFSVSGNNSHLRVID